MNIILEPLRLLFELMFNITGDWGIAIILLTITVRIMLLPLTLKTKINMKVDGEKKADIQEKLEKSSEDMKKSMSGCMGLMIQAPLLMAMFRVIKTIPLEISSVLVPWVAQLSIPDKTMIIPLLYILALSLPSLLCYFKYFRALLNRTFSRGSLMMNIIFGVLITVKAPVSLGIYFIAGSIITFLEEILVGLLYRRIS